MIVVVAAFYALAIAAAAGAVLCLWQMARD